jgi:hypothetical protein
MLTLRQYRRPPASWGIAGLALGTIGLLFFFLPVVGIPTSVAGLFFGLVGSVLAWPAGGARLRWALAGVAIAGLALGLGVALAYGPAGYLPEDKPRVPYQPPANRPYVPPPHR